MMIWYAAVFLFCHSIFCPNNPKRTKCQQNNIFRVRDSGRSISRSKQNHELRQVLAMTPLFSPRDHRKKPSLHKIGFLITVPVFFELTQDIYHNLPQGKHLVFQQETENRLLLIFHIYVPLPKGNHWLKHGVQLNQRYDDVIYKNGGLKLNDD